MARDQDGVEVKSMTDLVLVKKDMLQDVRAVRGMGEDLSDHHVVQCKVRLMCAWIKKKELVDGTWRIRNKKPRLIQYREGYTRCLHSRRAE